MKMTLLEMVQDIMSDMDSDAVESINDTVEAGQVAEVVKTIYDQMVTNRVIPERYELSTLSLPSAPTTKPNYMLIPSTLDHIVWLKYDKKLEGGTSNDFREVQYISPRDFMNLVQSNRSDAANVFHTTDPSSSVQYYVLNDKAPQWYTSFDDLNIAFDSYDAAIDTTGVVAAKSLVWGKLNTTFTLDDAYTPLIDDNLFPYLLAEAKSTCFVNLKQQANPKVDKQARDQKLFTQNHRFRSDSAQKASSGSSGPNYGRR